MRHCLIIFVLFIMGLSLVSCHENNSNIEQIEIDVSKELIVPKHYVVTKAKMPIIINGLADDEEWQHSEFTDYFIDIEGVIIPRYQTRAKLLWDNEYLYIYAWLEEENIWADILDRDAIVYYNNDFEVFLDPSSEGIAYGEIEINALGTEFDLLLNKAYRVGGKAIIQWSPVGLKTAVNINGSLNNHTDIDNSWSVEMAIPMKALIELKKKPRRIPIEGEQWKINFSRVNWEYDIIDGQYHRKKENDKYLPENNWVWSPQYVINMHEPEKWGVLQFTESNKAVDFIENPQNETEQLMYALFRKIRYGEQRNLLLPDSHSVYNIKAIIANDEIQNVSFHKTNFGFELVYINVDKWKYVINQDGELKVLK